MTMLWVDQVIFVLYLFMRMEWRVPHNEYEVLPYYSFFITTALGRKKEELEMKGEGERNVKGGMGKERERGGSVFFARGLLKQNGHNN